MSIVDFGEQEERLKNIKKREFSTGAQRDSSIGKPNCHDLQGYTLLRFGYHMELGEQQYGQSNYELGIPDEIAKESLARHYAKLMDGWDDEDHISSMIFNLQLLLLNQKKKGISADYYYNKIVSARKESKESKQRETEEI
jgi:hypothetical protein